MPRFGEGWQAADLASLSDRQRAELCSKWFRLRLLAGHTESHEPSAEVVKHDTEGFLSEVARSSDIDHLSRVPFLLTLLLYLRIQRGVFPSSRFKAFELMVAHLISEHPANRRIAASLGSSLEGLSQDELESTLAWVAFEMQKNQPGALIDERVLRESVRRFLTDDKLGLGLDSSDAHKLLGKFTENAEGSLGILVRKTPKELGFFHRSFQEYLAGLHLSRLAQAEQESFVRNYFDDPRWREVLLALFSLTRRPDELKALVETMEPSTLRQRLLVAELRAEVAFGDFDCPTNWAKVVAEETFLTIEEGDWLQHRERLLQASLQGLHSTRTSEAVRRHVRRWIYSRTGWRPGWLWAMQKWPPDDITRTVLLGRLNDEDPGVQRSAASVLAVVFRADADIGDRLAKLALESPSRTVRASAIDALSVGWPGHRSMRRIIECAELSQGAEVRLAAARTRIARRTQNQADFQLLLELSRRRNELSVEYHWRRELADTLLKGWRGDRVLRAICLKAARSDWDLREEQISPEVAISVLLQGFPHDPDVAQWCVREISGHDSNRPHFPFIGMHFGRRDAWSLLAENFRGDSVIVEAVDSWLQGNKVDTMELAFASLVGRTPKAKRTLIETLTATFPHWSAWALLEGWGIEDSEVSEALTPIALGSARRASQIAHLIPRIITSASAARSRLLEILKDGDCARHDFVVAGLGALSAQGDDTQVVDACLEVLSGGRGLDLDATEHELIGCFPASPAIRELTLKRLRFRDPPISAAAQAFANDTEIRSEIAEVVQPLPRSLRAQILTKLGNQPLEDRFASSVLQDYDVEHDDELKTIASIAYHRSVRRLGTEVNIDKLLASVSSYGPDYEERRRAAFAGLLALERISEIRDLQEQIGDSKPVSIDLGRFNEPNLPLVRLVAEKWGYLKSVFGDSLPDRLSRWHHNCWSALCRASSVDSDLQIDILSKLDADSKLAVDPHALAFLAQIKPRSQALLDRCLAALSAPNTDFQRGSLFAAELLAENFGGNEKVLSTILETFPPSRWGDRVVIQRFEVALALCLGWPKSPLIDELREEALREPGSARDYEVFFELVLSRGTPREFCNRTRWYLSRDSVQANVYISRALAKAATRRLRQDPEAERLFVDVLLQPLRPFEKASIPRLLTNANGLSPRVEAYCIQELERQATLPSFDLGFDAISAEVRGVYLSLLDALSGPVRQIPLDEGAR